MQDTVISSIKKHSYDLSAWFEKHLRRIPVPLMTTITIKDGGFKVAPSDMQLFPIGLNNLCKTDQAATSALVKKYFKKYHSDIKNLKKVLILATVDHANPFYYEHLLTLVKIIKKAKLQVELATIEPIDKPVIIKTPSKKTLKILPSFIEGKRLKVGKFDADFIYMTYPYPSRLTVKLSEIHQTINPPLKVLSYRDRGKFKKSDYFAIFNRLVGDFAEVANIDPWLLKSEFNVEHHVNFEEKSGVEKIAMSAESLIGILQLKYKEYHVEKAPTVRIVNNGGTYGMGMISIGSSKDLAALYKKKKKKKAGGKGQSIINDILIREEVPGVPLFKKHIGETVIYLIGNEVAGGFIRTYTDKASRNILSSRQDLFLPVCLSAKTHSHAKKRNDKKFNLLYSNLSRIGGVACGYEIDKIPS